MKELHFVILEKIWVSMSKVFDNNCTFWVTGRYIATEIFFEWLWIFYPREIKKTRTTVTKLLKKTPLFFASVIIFLNRFVNLFIGCLKNWLFFSIFRELLKRSNRFFYGGKQIFLREKSPTRQKNSRIWKHQSNLVDRGIQTHQQPAS